MKLTKPNIPKKLDADVAMAIVVEHMDALAGKRPTYIYEFKGVSQRTALGDNLAITVRNRQNAASSVKFSLKRDSLYHILPEYLFHSLDHYLGTDGDTEEFDKRYKDQEEQRDKALAYFKPFDRHLQLIRTKYQQWLNKNVFSGNQFLSDFITDGYEVDLNNPYIKAVYPCLSWVRDFRGNDEMVMTALGYAFVGNADVEKVYIEADIPISDNVPSTIGDSLNDLYCGSTFIEKVCVWSVFYQTEVKTEEHLKQIKAQVSEFCEFFSAWFLPLKDELAVSFGDKQAKPDLFGADDAKGIFLNYSTQLI